MWQLPTPVVVIPGTTAHPFARLKRSGEYRNPLRKLGGAGGIAQSYR